MGYGRRKFLKKKKEIERLKSFTGKNYKTLKNGPKFICYYKHILSS